MRICELTSLECGAIAVSKAPVEGEPDVPYIVFASPKGARGDGCWIEAKCIMNEIALEAYDTLTDICADRRAALKTNRLIVFPAQKKPDIDPGSFYMKYRKFFVDHREAIPCLNTQDLYPQLLSASAVCAAGLSKSEDAKRRFDRVYPDLDQKRDVIVYPGTHQFRSTLNSELRKRGVDWRFIQMNMSHLRADSPDSYVYDRQQTDEECSEAVYRMIFGGEARMLGRHADDFMAAVEEFLENRGINAAEHIDQMVEAAAGRFPLRAKAGGVCIRCGQVVPCSENEQTDELLCAFEACPNHCHFFFNIPRSYALAKERAEIARHNRLKGWKKAAENESLKLRNIVRDSLLPELKELEREISARGCDDVTKRHPSLASIVANIEEVRRETESWMEG